MTRLGRRREEKSLATAEVCGARLRSLVVREVLLKVMFESRSVDYTHAMFQ